MILYLVVNTKDHSITAPAIAPDHQHVLNALDTINPENKDDLVIHELLQFESLYDLFLLSLDENKKLPDFLLNRSVVALEENATTHQAEGAVGDLHGTN